MRRTDGRRREVLSCLRESFERGGRSCGYRRPDVYWIQPPSPIGRCDEDRPDHCRNHRAHPYLDDWELFLHWVSGEESGGRFHKPQQGVYGEERAVLVCERVGSGGCPWSSGAGSNAAWHGGL